MTDYRLAQLDREIFLTGSEAAWRLADIVGMLEDFAIESLPSDTEWQRNRRRILRQAAHEGKVAAERFAIAKDDLNKYLHLKAFPKQGAA